MHVDLEKSYAKVTVGITLLTLLGLAFYAGKLEGRVVKLEEKYAILDIMSERQIITTGDIDYIKQTLVRIERDLNEARETRRY